MAQDGDEALAADLVECARTGIIALPPDDSDEDGCAGIALPDSATCRAAGEPEDDALDAIWLLCSDDDAPSAVAQQPDPNGEGTISPGCPAVCWRSFSCVVAFAGVTSRNGSERPRTSWGWRRRSCADRTSDCSAPRGRHARRARAAGQG